MTTPNEQTRDPTTRSSSRIWRRRENNCQEKFPFPTFIDINSALYLFDSVFDLDVLNFPWRHDTIIALLQYFLHVIVIDSVAPRFH